MTICRFKTTSTEKILNGSWTPFSLDYYPFANVDEFCNPCFRWRYLDLIRGCNSRWENLLVNPNDTDENFPQYLRTSKRFREFSVVLVRAIARSSFPDSILQSLRQPVLLLDSIRGNVEPEDYDIRAMIYVSSMLERLNSEGVLPRYRLSHNSLFNLQVLNENFDIYREDQRNISLTETRNAAIGTTRQRTPNTYTWRGNLAIFGTIPIINLDQGEIRTPVLVADNFFNPSLNLTDDLNTPGGIHLFFINQEFHKMWILRESLAQLIEDGRLPLDLHDDMDNRIFTAAYNLNNYDFREFDIIVDTIDHSFRLNPQTNFRLDTGQAAIIFDLLYRNYPGSVNFLQDMDPCPINIGQGTPHLYSCPMGGNMGCGMKDRRIEGLQFPRDRIETNIYKFLRYLRDETVFSHEALYKITRLYPRRLTELNQFSAFWVGGIYIDASQRWIFRISIPAGWEAPEINEYKYELCLISPLCFEKGYKVVFESQLSNTEYVIRPVSSMNPWYQDDPLNNARMGNTLECIIGKLSIDENIYNLKRQKKQLVRAIQYQSRSLAGNTAGERENEILESRLRERYKRIALATFGRFARYV